MPLLETRFDAEVRLDGADRAEVSCLLSFPSKVDTVDAVFAGLFLLLRWWVRTEVVESAAWHRSSCCFLLCPFIFAHKSHDDLLSEFQQGHPPQFRTCCSLFHVEIVGVDQKNLKHVDRAFFVPANRLSKRGVVAH